MNPRRFLSELRDGERVQAVLLFTEASLARTRQDKPYLRCTLGDRSGSLPARMWDIDEPTWRSLASVVVAEIDGGVESYQDQKQIVIRAISAGRPTPELMRELLPASVRDPEEMFAELKDRLATLEHPFMRALADAYLGDAELMERFKRSPAAAKLHHAYLGGLLEHVLTLVKLADAVCPVYPAINRDVVIVSLLAHDMAKTIELTSDVGFEYTERGQLVGHVVDGVHILRQKIREASGKAAPPTGAATVLEHILLSHHGDLAFGAAKIPATPEAIVVNMLDNLDAKTVMALAAVRSGEAEPGAFTEKVWALGTKLYKRDPFRDGPNVGGLFS